MEQKDQQLILPSEKVDSFHHDDGDDDDVNVGINDCIFEVDCNDNDTEGEAEDEESNHNGRSCTATTTTTGARITNHVVGEDGDDDGDDDDDDDGKGNGKDGYDIDEGGKKLPTMSDFFDEEQGERIISTTSTVSRGRKKKKKKKKNFFFKKDLVASAANVSADDNDDANDAIAHTNNINNSTYATIWNKIRNVITTRNTTTDEYIGTRASHIEDDVRFGVDDDNAVINNNNRVYLVNETDVIGNDNAADGIIDINHKHIGSSRNNNDDVINIVASTDINTSTESDTDTGAITNKNVKCYLPDSYSLLAVSSPLDHPLLFAFGCLVCALQVILLLLMVLSVVDKKWSINDDTDNPDADINGTLVERVASFVPPNVSPLVRATQVRLSIVIVFVFVLFGIALFGIDFIIWCVTVMLIRTHQIFYPNNHRIPINRLFLWYVISFSLIRPSTTL